MNTCETEEDLIDLWNANKPDIDKLKTSNPKADICESARKMKQKIKGEVNERYKQANSGSLFTKTKECASPDITGKMMLKKSDLEFENFTVKMAIPFRLQGFV